jgi:CRISPR-associated endonuclease/helicase Cas3
MAPPSEDGQTPAGLDGPVGALRRSLTEGEDPDLALEGLLDALKTLSPADPLTAAVIGRLVAAGPRVTAYPAGVVLTARVRPGFHQAGAGLVEGPVDAEEGEAEDDASSLRAGTYAPAAVGLGRHLRGVADRAAAFAAGLGLGEDLRAALTRAAELHDLGKADPRFQFLLYGDEPGDDLLAKSGREFDPGQERRVRARAGLPPGFRHEFVSVALLRRHPRDLLGAADEDRRRLVEYLVGVHHGRGRPFVPVVEESGAEDFGLEWEGHTLSASPDHGLWRLDSGWADGFWRLVRGHGYWGLAYLEALLRLADGARSAEEQREGGEGA